MDWNTFITNEAISNYVVFFLGVVVTFLGIWLKQIFIKPPIILLEKQKELSLIELRPEAIEKLKISYKDNPIKDFYLTVFNVKNKSSHTIKNIKLHLHIDWDSFTQIIDMDVEDPLKGIRTPPTSVGLVNTEQNSLLEISLSYLNCFKKTKDNLKFSVFSQKQIQIKELIGGGEGWTSRYIDKVALLNAKEEILLESNSALELMFRLFVPNFGLKSIMLKNNRRINKQ